MTSKIAEALVECGYADRASKHDVYRRGKGFITGEYSIKVDPFVDTLEGRRQADALIDWLQTEHDMLWVKCWLDLPVNPEAMGWRNRCIECIKLCFEQLDGQK